MSRMMSIKPERFQCKALFDVEIFYQLLLWIGKEGKRAEIKTLSQRRNCNGLIFLITRISKILVLLPLKQIPRLKVLVHFKDFRGETLMQIDEKEAFSDFMATLGKLYNKQFSEALLDIYWRVLKRFEFSDLCRALESEINSFEVRQFFPKPADIVRLIDETDESRALDAWNKVETTICRMGAYASVVFDDLIIHAVVEQMGGWPKLCSLTLDDLLFRVNEFKRRYITYINKPPIRHPKCLYGLAAISNRARGYAVQAPVLIGDAQKARQVFLSGGGMLIAFEYSGQLIVDSISSTFCLMPKLSLNRVTRHRVTHQRFIFY